jgi:CxxC motif-containing protein (DUF1111 family)
MNRRKVSRGAAARGLALALVWVASVAAAQPVDGPFGQPEPGADFETLSDFRLGRAVFEREWEMAGAGSAAFDGLGPLHNAPSCAACHVKDGRGRPPDGGDGAIASLLAVLAGPDGAPDPVLGHQLQDFAVSGAAAEGRLAVTWTAVGVTLADGTAVELRRPRFAVQAPPGAGPDPATRIGPRLAPQLIGLGLLERVGEADIAALADPADRDGDGISGRANRVDSPSLGGAALGRFGWKAGRAGVGDQIARALARDMGLSSRLEPDGHGDCTDRQPACRAQPTGADPDTGLEVANAILGWLTAYASNLAVPPPRPALADARGGEALFHGAGCARCHVPALRTRADPDAPHLSGRQIRPYTDLLLHDMGEDLADGIGEGLASGTEWRTPPLWGVGLADAVNGNAFFLHDGRARSVTEAILWHGGEAAPAREAFAAMGEADRARLVAFVESL